MARSFLDSIVGSFSSGAAANPTVAMMDAAFDADDLDWRYINCEVPPGDLAAAVAGAWAMGWRGFNCSMPHKQAVIAHLQDLSTSARLCQAVNCVVRSDTGWVGHNTDGSGFRRSVEAVTSVGGIEAMIIGSGGAAFAIAVALAEAGAARINLASRRRAPATTLAALLSAETSAVAAAVDWAEPLGIPPGTGLVINATPVGSDPGVDQAVDVDWGAVGPNVVAADVVFNPPLTAFLGRARDVGATIVDGTGMLVNQAAENIRLWTGRSPDIAPMRAALESALEIR